MALSKDDIAWIEAVIRDRVNHEVPSPETKEQIKAIYLQIESLQKDKVSWRHFTWILATILSLYVIISSAIWLELKTTQSQVATLSSGVTEISTILRQAEITK